MNSLGHRLPGAGIDGRGNAAGSFSAAAVGLVPENSLR